jgi:hypothetical protein
MMTTTKQTILKQSSAVRTTVLPEVRKVVDTVEPDYDGVKRYRTDIVKWLKPVVDLSEFHVYPINGITEGLDRWWGHSENKIWRADGEYQWVDHKYHGSAPHYVYQSVPSAKDGNYCPVDAHVKVALDLAYVGSTGIQKIELHDGVEKVFYSLSKPFGIRNVRTGWYFSRTPDYKLQALIHAAKYYNYYAHHVSERLINSFDIDYVHTRLHTEQTRVCDELNLLRSDSVWLATTKNSEYAKFRRYEDVARICLSGVYNIC